MAETQEQRVLMGQILGHVQEIQEAARAAMPGNTVLHEEFQMGAETPTTVAETLALGNAVYPVAREYRGLILSRGIDAGKIAHLKQQLGNLEAIAHIEAPPANPPARGKRKKAGGRKART